MRLTAGIALGIAALALAALWASGTFALIAHRVVAWQHALQATLAESLGHLRAGDPGALWSLVLVCGLYGFAHALGPGHGKLLVSGAAVASRATAARMSLIAVAGSLAQAATAILIVYGGFALFETSARGTVAASEAWIAPAGSLVIALVGAHLLRTGARSLLRAPAHQHHHHHHHHPEDCGHRHGPSLEEAASITPKGALALIGAMAARPCSGALVVLILAWSYDLKVAGLVAALAMGLGTAAFTLAIAIAAVAGRDAAVFSAGSGPVARLLLPGLRIAAGSVILAVSIAQFLAAATG